MDDRITDTLQRGIHRSVGQRAYVTVLFSDVSGSSEHAEQLEAEEYARLLERFREFAREIVPRHGGSIARLQGDGVLALFGHTQPREDDGRRATEAALELHAAVAGLRAGAGAHAKPLRMHSGVHGGLVLLLAGDIERGRYDVVGEVPNTAARLCALAEPGEVAVSDESLGPRAAHFVVTKRGALRIRGRCDPLTVLRICSSQAPLQAGTGARRFDAAIARGTLPFIGREGIIEELLAGAARSANGPAEAVVLVGEPGIGKTRTMTEFAARLRVPDVTVLQGHCESYLTAQPLQPFLQCVRALAERDDARPAVADALQGLSRMRMGSITVSDAAAARAALLELLCTQARLGRLVLLLDDWQWADDASRALLQALWSSAERILVVLAVRPLSPEELAFPEAHVLHLAPLDATQCVRAIASCLPGADPLVVDEIVAQSGGTPLFIEELCHASAAGAEISPARHGRGLSWLNALVASRLSRLSTNQVDALQVASVLGPVVDLGLLEQLQDKRAPSLAASLDGLDFVIPAEQEGAIRFRHLLTRDAIYATVDLELRRELHRRVAMALLPHLKRDDAPGVIEALAHHFDAGGMAAEAAYYAEAAGNRSLAAMALDRARQHYLTALRNLDALPVLSDATRLRWCEIAQKLGQTCVFDVLDVEQLLVLFQRAATLAREVGNQNTLARAEYWLGYVYYGRGQPRHAVRHCETALQLAQASQDGRLAAQVQATLGQSLASASCYERAMPLLLEAVESKRKHSRSGSGAAIGSAYTLGRIGYTLGDLGRFDEATAAFEESLTLLGDPLHAVGASIRELQCAVHLWQGRWAEASEAGRTGAAIAQRCRSRFNSAMGRALAACGDWAEHGDDDALHVLREATHWIEMRGGAVSTSLNYGWLVEATLARGLEDEARAHMARLLLRARAQDHHGEAQGWRAMALAAARRGDKRRAARCLTAAARAAGLRGSLRETAVNALATAEVAAIAGDRAVAQRQLEVAACGFEAMKMRWHLQRAGALAAGLR
ncbi:AAA family ATPase [Aquincola sp. J276]|uniref:ATP-binding protein n=1 Tax=Aquincola sp. J276 TaxID=2898432 RepID=UPI0021515518|nr:AAA family ATPase [Aquincola sp. J276]MCR5868234.1 AAA family ATPase [Aquincola sp. J276]